MPQAPNQSGSNERNVDRQTAQDTVFENLGLDPSELGIDDMGGDLDGGDDLPGGDNDDQGGQQTRQQDDGDGIPDRNRGQQRQDDRLSQTRDQQRPLPRGAEVKADARGNLVDANGRVVARAGKEARLYQDASNAKRQLAPLQTQVRETTERLNKVIGVARQYQGMVTELQASQKAVKDLGLAPDEQLRAMTMFIQLRDSPVEALKQLLTRAAANGIKADQLGMQNGGIDQKAMLDVIRQEVEKVTGPITQRNQQDRLNTEAATRQAQIETEARTEVETFFSQNPDAAEYAQVISEVLKHPDYAGKAISDVWAHIQLRMLQNPELRRNRSQGRDNQNARGRNGSRSLPSGRGTPMGDPRGDDMANPTDSYDSILKGVMKEVGIV